MERFKFLILCLKIVLTVDIGLDRTNRTRIRNFVVISDTPIVVNPIRLSLIKAVISIHRQDNFHLTGIQNTDVPSVQGVLHN